MLANLVEVHKPDDVHFIRIARWFDQKWLRYSGKGLIQNVYNVMPGTSEVALDVYWRDKLTVPPFNSNRVLEQVSFERKDRSYNKVQDPRRIHSGVRTHSARNLNNRIDDLTSSGLFVWFSSSSAQTERASVMTYTVNDAGCGSWFASFMRKGDAWHLHRTKGVDEAFVLTWFPTGRR